MYDAVYRKQQGFFDVYLVNAFSPFFAANNGSDITAFGNFGIPGKSDGVLLGFDVFQFDFCRQAFADSQAAKFQRAEIARRFQV